MFRKIGFFSNKDNGFSWWWFGIKVGIITALIVWWWLENKEDKSQKVTSGEDSHTEPRSIPLPLEDTKLGETQLESAVEAPAPSTTGKSEPDDLTKIEGIGPKSNAALQNAGIRTFQNLAAYEPAALKQVLVDGGVRIGYPDTWPEQAALAARGDWEALEKLQSGLKGGRRID